MHKLKFKARVWVYPGVAAWHFVSLPKTLGKALKSEFSGLRRGFGSIRVKARVGDTVFLTSIFPDTKQGTYLLPLKKSVRKSENLQAGKLCEVLLEF